LVIFFGFSVSIYGNNAVVGAINDNTGETDTGAAYIFDTISGNLLHTIFNPNPGNNDNFAAATSISGNNVLISTVHDEIGPSQTGAAYLFDAITGNLLHTFLNPTPQAQDLFGRFLAISGNNVLITAINDDTVGDMAGAVYLFDATTGNLLHTFLNPTPDIDEYGESVSIYGNNVLIGSYRHRDNPVDRDVGIAYLYDATTGNLLHILQNPTPERNDKFGTSVSIYGNNVLVGADDDNTAGTNTGAAYLFDVSTILVGGKIIPIESTSLILAGAQSFSWMIPVVLSVLGIGLFVVSRQSFNSIMPRHYS